MHVTAVICTHNRAATYLPRSLTSLLAQAPETPTYDILVIDNASGDDTRSVVARLSAAHPGKVGYVHEPILGLSHARNRALAEARGDVVAFLDDDAVAGPRWVATIHSHFLESPSLGLLGGPALPIWEAPRPSWFHPSLSGVVGIQEPQLEGKGRVVGGNFALRRSIFESSAPFNPALGRVGGRLLQGEDDAIEALARALGHEVAIDPGLVVHHHVNQLRLTRHYFLRWAWGSGESLARMHPTRAWRARWLRVAAHGARAVVGMIRCDEAGSFAQLFEATRQLALATARARAQESGSREGWAHLARRRVSAAFSRNGIVAMRKARRTNGSSIG